MSAGIMIFPGAQPSRNRNGGAVYAELRFYENETTTPKTVYTTSALNVALPFPVVSDDAGRFPAIWADDAQVYTANWATADGQSITLDNLTASLAADATILAETEAALDTIEALVAGYAGTVLFTFSTTRTDSDPGAGKLRFNNATLASVTFLYVDNTDASGVAATTYLDSIGAGDIVTVRSLVDAAKFALFTVTGAVVDGTGYRKIPVTWLDGATEPGDLTNVSFNYSPIGAQGATGPTGPQGPPGPSGPGTGDVSGPATNTDNYVPQWDGPNSLTLKDGRAIGAGAGTDLLDRDAGDARYEPAITTLDVTKGGTGAATLAENGVLIGNGTNAVQVTAVGTAGQVLTSNGAGSDPTFQNATSGVSSFAIVQDQKSSGTTGGSLTAGGWRTRVLNTEVYDPSALVTVASNQITINVAGTYEIEAFGTVASDSTTTSACRSRLYDISGGATIAQGENVQVPYNTTDSVAAGILTHVVGVLVVPSTKIIEHQTFPSASVTCGTPVSSGEVEVYSTVIIRKKS